MPDLLSPGCTCYTPPPPPIPCVIFDDDFDRSDNANPGSDWTETDFEIKSNKLRCTASGGDCFCNTARTSTDDAYLEVEVTAAATGDIIRICIAADDKDKYVYGELTVGASGTTWALYEYDNSGGGPATTTLIGGPVTDATNLKNTATVALCYFNARSGYDATVTFGLLSTVLEGHRIQGNTTFSGLYSGLHCDTLAASWIDFDTFSYQRNKTENNACNGCPCSLCDFCANPGMPYELELDIAGVVYTSGPCSTLTCGQLNATWTLECSGSSQSCSRNYMTFGVEDFTYEGDYSCDWEPIITESSRAFFHANIVDDGGGNYSLIAAITSFAAFFESGPPYNYRHTSTIYFKKTYTAKPDCLNFVDEALTYWKTEGTVDCDWSSATVKITAVAA